LRIGAAVGAAQIGEESCEVADYYGREHKWARRGFAGKECAGEFRERRARATVAESGGGAEAASE